MQVWVQTPEPQTPPGQSALERQATHQGLWQYGRPAGQSPSTLHSLQVPETQWGKDGAHWES